MLRFLQCFTCSSHPDCKGVDDNPIANVYLTASSSPAFNQKEFKAAAQQHQKGEWMIDRRCSASLPLHHRALSIGLESFSDRATGSTSPACTTTPSYLSGSLSQITYRISDNASSSLMSHAGVINKLCHEVSRTISGSVAPLQQLRAELRKLQWLGQGGSGVVFKAEWKGAQVAVKFVVSNTDHELQDNVQEAVMNKLLSHPNVVHTYSAQVMPVESDWQDSIKASALSFTGATLFAAGRAQSEFICDILGSLDNLAIPRPLHSSPGAFIISDDGPSSAPTPRVSPPAASSNKALQPRLSKRELHSSQMTPWSEANSNFPSDDTCPDSAPCTSAAAVTAAKQRRFSSTASCENFSLGGSFTQKKKYNFGEALGLLNCHLGQFVTVIVMENCDRGSLQQAITKGLFQPSKRWGKGTALRSLVRTAREVAQGMAYLHANSIIHGDLKPGNVLLKSCRSDKRGFTARVSDFGHSKVEAGSDAAAQGTHDSDDGINHMATLVYTAPEAVNGKIQAASDVYSFGMVLYQMASGQMPFAEYHWAQVLGGLMEGSLAVEWPDSVHPVVKKLGVACLQHAPESRPAFDSIVALLARLEECFKKGSRMNEGGDSVP